MGLAGAGILCFLATALLGPSAEEAPLRGGASLTFAAQPPAWLPIALVACGIVLGAGGVGLGLAALAQGYAGSARRLVVWGLLAGVALAVLPPVGSTDHLNYAAYGRMVVLGHSPYVAHPGLAADPVIGSVQEWTNTPSIYGPLLTLQQAFASWAGGTSVRWTVLVLSLTDLAAFALTALLLHRRARTPRARLRAALLWTCNPLLLFHLVSGAHNDAFGIAAAVAALTLFTTRSTIHGSRTPDPGGVGRAFAVGALAGAGAAIKLPAALAGGGPAWEYLRARAWGRLVAVFAGAALVAGAAFGVAGGTAFDQVRTASRSVSLASPWHLAVVAGAHRNWIQLGSLLLMLVLLALLLRALPADREGLRVSVALVVAWLFAAQYALPWYDGLGWAMLALTAASAVDWVLLAHTALISLAYLPARRADVIGLPHGLWWLERTLRPKVMPWALASVLLALALVALRRRRAPREPAAPAPGSAVRPG